MLFGLFKRRNLDAETGIYRQIVAQARQPAFYTKYAVPDTVDGRFDMVLIHAILYFRRLRGEGKKISEFSQTVFDVFAQDMDASLREMGVSDTRVPKKVRKMGEAFYGRAEVYSTALDEQDLEGLAAAIGRNVFPESDEPVAQNALAAYMFKTAELLGNQDTETLTGGEIAWPEP